MTVAVSVLVPREPGEDASAFREELEVHLRRLGKAYEIILTDEGRTGVAVRRAVADAAGEVVAIMSPHSANVPILGDALAMVDSGKTDAVFVGRHGLSQRQQWLRRLLVPMLPDAGVRFTVLSSAAAKLTAGESRLNGSQWDLEIAYLLNKYGFHIEVIETEASGTSRAQSLPALMAAMRIRLHDRYLAYRAARRCPVCFSPDVWSCGQVPGNVVRECKRCRCRYLNRLWEQDVAAPVHRVPGQHEEPSVPAHSTHSVNAREKTSIRRLTGIRRQLPARSRILEIGIRDASFGVLAAKEYEYVGIDRANAAARAARTRGLEAYCASLSNFVNTGPPFDAVVIYHVLESMPDPHDALARVKEFLKPGGFLFLTSFDTEGLLYLLTEGSTIEKHFQSHLILYSRSALIELLERSGFEIASVAPDYVYRDHKVLRHWLSGKPAPVAAAGRAALAMLPDPLLVSSGSLTVIARRRVGHHLNHVGIRSAEPTHVR